MLKFLLPLFAVSSLFSPAQAAAEPLKIVAAENFYGDVAKQIGGQYVKVASIVSNPDQDPHLFEASPSIAKELSTADIVISNGLDYDPWFEKLLSASASTHRQSLVAGDLAGLKSGDNPHIWYDLKVMNQLANALAETLATRDPVHAEDYRRNELAFETSLAPVATQIAQIAEAKKGVPVAATEPVFGYMFAAMGLEAKEQDFQRAVMNDTEPAISDVANFEADLKSGGVKLFVYNKQASSPLAEKMMALARAHAIPVVPVTETEPPGKTYQQWLGEEVKAVGQALGAKK
jgi:zinc/manganese transport system substrate-binding protein